jgi:methionyl aminopeptidase
MIKIKTPEEIKIMQEGGEICSSVLQEVLKSVKEGITTRELDKIADLGFQERGAEASFKKVADYTYATCININEGIVHGIPNEYELKKGDIVSIDLGAFYKGFHTDLSYTVEVGTNNEEEFLNVGKAAIQKAIDACRVGNKIGDVSNAMQKEIERHGYSVSRDLVGHGVGRELHEDPYVPCYGKAGSGALLKEGMVLAVEAIYQKGKPDLSLASDGWTLKTRDNSISGLFENTVAILKEGPKLITRFS